MTKEHEPKEPTRKIVSGNLWDWEEIAQTCRMIGEFSFKFFRTNPHGVEAYPRLAQFVNRVQYEQQGTLLIPHGPTLKVFNGIGFLVENEQGELVDENLQPVERIKNIPTLTLLGYGRKIQHFTQLLPDKIGDLSLGDRHLARGGKMTCSFDFNERFLIGQVPVWVKIRPLKALVRQQMAKARQQGLI